LVFLVEEGRIKAIGAVLVTFWEAELKVFPTQNDINLLQRVQPVPDSGRSHIWQKK